MCIAEQWRLSKKKETELYNIVHEEIMQARIKIRMKNNNKPIFMDEIDNILSDLCKNAPQKAIDLFKK